jgi:hypothetical protein
VQRVVLVERDDDVIEVTAISLDEGCDSFEGVATSGVSRTRYCKCSSASIFFRAEIFLWVDNQQDLLSTLSSKLSLGHVSLSFLWFSEGIEVASGTDRIRTGTVPNQGRSTIWRTVPDQCSQGGCDSAARLPIEFASSHHVWLHCIEVRQAGVEPTSANW